MRLALARCRSFCTAVTTGLRALLPNRRGQAGVITAILAPVIVGAAALAIDAALWQANQKSLQGAADQAAIGGVNAFVLSGNTDSVGADTAAANAALAVANGFGYPTCSTSGCPCSTGSYGACAGTPVTTSATQCVNSKTNCLQVTITEQQTRYLSAVVFSTDPVASAKATATVGSGGACVLALDQNPAGGGSPPVNPPSVSIGGSSQLNLIGCNLVNNLNDPVATQNDTDVTGSSTLSATNGGQILLAQTKTFFGQGTVTPTPIYGVSPAPDPYASRAAPTVTGCTFTSFGDNGNNSNPANITTSKALTPGTYCGGLNVVGGTVTLAPGTYVMDGGGFNVAGNSTVTGTGVTIYITCDAYAIAAKVVNNCTGSSFGSVKVTGAGGNCPGTINCNVNGVCEEVSPCNLDSDCPASQNLKRYCVFDPAVTGYYGNCGSLCTGNIKQPKVTLTPPVATTNPPSGTAGISIWIDKNAPTGASAIFTGDAGLNLNGAIYAPSQAVTYEGGAASSSTCSQLVSLTINLSGGHDTQFSQQGCASNSGVASKGTPKLVE